MRVFVTGATGFIGSAVVEELIGAGHRVLGLARSDAAASSLIDAGAEVHRGSLEDLDSLRLGAVSADGVIHTAYIHDFSKPFELAAATDERAIAALSEALAGSGRPLVVTSGTMVLKPGRVGTEEDAADSAGAATHRIAAEKAALATVASGVRVSVVRLPPSVHGEGDHAFIPALIAVAKAKGASGYVGDGSNRWPAVHRRDAARLFRLALEGSAAGSRYHGVADEGIPFREIADVIGRRLNLPVVSVASSEASTHFGWLAFVVGVDGPVSADLTRQRLGWRAVHPSLLADLDAGSYFPG